MSLILNSAGGLLLLKENCPGLSSKVLTIQDRDHWSSLSHIVGSLSYYIKGLEMRGVEF